MHILLLILFGLGFSVFFIPVPMYGVFNVGNVSGMLLFGGAFLLVLLRERLNTIAADPCVRYGVTDLANIGIKKRPLLPVGCSVADLLNFASELVTHHADLLKSDSTLHAFAGTVLAKGFDLEDLYPNAVRTSAFYLNNVDFSQEAA